MVDGTLKYKNQQTNTCVVFEKYSGALFHFTGKGNVLSLVVLISLSYRNLDILINAISTPVKQTTHTLINTISTPIKQTVNTYKMLISE